MNCQQHVFLFCAFCLSYAFLGVFAFEKKVIQQTVRVSDTDRTVRSVNIKNLRSMSIDAYMTGGALSLQGTGYSESDLALTAAAAILMTALILTCTSYTCSKHLMRDFYRIHKT